MTYTIECVGTDRGWEYRVTLWVGRVAYRGERTYAEYRGAMRAAKASGAIPKPERK